MTTHSMREHFGTEQKHTSRRNPAIVSNQANHVLVRQLSGDALLNVAVLPQADTGHIICNTHRDVVSNRCATSVFA